MSGGIGAYALKQDGLIEIGLTKGMSTIIDAADLHLIEGFGWYARRGGRGKWYASATKGGKKIHLHRLIINAPAEAFVDHINGDSLDNRRSNLRLCDNAQNQWNRRKLTGASGVRGVVWKARDKIWEASIMVRGKLHHLGSFSSVETAAQIRREAERKYWGEFAP